MINDVISSNTLLVYIFYSNHIQCKKNSSAPRPNLLFVGVYIFHQVPMNSIGGLLYEFISFALNYSFRNIYIPN